MALGLAESLPRAAQLTVIDRLARDLWENPAKATLLSALSRWMED